MTPRYFNNFADCHFLGQCGDYDLYYRYEDHCYFHIMAIKNENHIRFWPVLPSEHRAINEAQKRGGIMFALQNFVEMQNFLANQNQP